MEHQPHRMETYGMKFLVFALTIAMFLVTPTLSGASSLAVISISEMTDKSDLIILGEVVSIKSDSSLDFVTVKIIEIIKGNTEASVVSITLQVRGGLKEFDPVLQNNEFGVFYLRKKLMDMQLRMVGALLFSNIPLSSRPLKITHYQRRDKTILSTDKNMTGGYESNLSSASKIVLLPTII